MGHKPDLTADLHHIHNILRRGFDRAHQHAVALCDGSSNETAGYLVFARTLLIAFHGHHETEDHIVFPTLAGKIGDLGTDELADEHKQMEQALADATDAVERLAKDSANEDARTRLRDSLGELKDLIAPHFAKEEAVFTAEKLDAAMSDAEQTRFHKRVAAHGRSHGGPGPLAVPFMLYNLDDRERAEFGKAFPWILRKFLVPVVWKGKWAPMRPYLAHPPE